MRTLLRQEGFKLLKKKSTYLVTLVIIIIILGQAFLGKIYPKAIPVKMFFTSSFGATTMVVFVLIAASATSLSMEFQYGTIKELIYQQYSRSTILLSKWLIMFAYSLYLYIMTGIVALIGKVIFANNKFALGDNDIYSNHLTFLQQWLSQMGSSFITLWLVLSVVFLFATLFKSSTVAVTAGIVGFFALNAIGILMFKVIDKFHWFRWNPFNFLNYANQVTDPARQALTKLTNNQLLIGSLIYTVIFFGIGLTFFRKRNV
ncbi:MAG: ABC transporter permease [Lentilactobacillus diolivorans]|jgi:ABC-2 type transport system permease protein|nr:ABC transporter permease [Lentilactobacillus diolivorans]RRG04062.1 MAG: ABC transporter permease [Lactobacillus sp.]